MMKKIMLPLLVSLLFTGCATTKISTDTRNQLNQTQVALKQQPVALLMNSCLLTNELGKDLILFQQSQLSSEKFIELLNQELNNQGVQVGQTASPVICAVMPEDQLKKYDYIANETVKRAAIENYPLLNNQSPVSAEHQKAIVELYQFINKTNQVYVTNAYNKKKQLPLPVLDVETVNTLKDWSKSNFIFVSSIDGLKASMGSKLTAGALSVGVTLATLGAGGGLVTSYLPKEGQSYTVHLFDLDTQKSVWVKSLALKGHIYSIKNHSVNAENILDPLFEKPKK